MDKQIIDQLRRQVRAHYLRDVVGLGILNTMPLERAEGL